MTSQGNPLDPAWPFVRTLLAYEELGSTNDCAAARVREGNVALPLAVWARRQTRGRGRGSHSWWSDAGSLTFTLAIDPAAHGLTLEAEPKLALGTAVAVIDALNELGFESAPLGIRWPNDIEVDDLKLGGILPERAQTENGRRTLIGVGLNVLTDFTNAPADVGRMATSLAAIHGGPRDEQMLSQVFSAVLRHFGPMLERLVTGDQELARRWDQLDRLRGRRVTIDLGTRLVDGIGCGIDPDGALVLETDGRQIHLFGGRALRP